MKTQTRPSPPKLAKKLLISFLRDDLAEEVQGDMEEKFYSIVKTRSLFRAKLNNGDNVCISGRRKEMLIRMFEKPS